MSEHLNATRDGLARAIADVEVMTHPKFDLPVFLSFEQAERVADAALAYLAERSSDATQAFPQDDHPSPADLTPPAPMEAP